MGKNTDKVREAVRIVRHSLSHIREIASDQLSRRSTGTEPWTTVRDSLERILARSRQPSSPPTNTSNGQVAPLVQQPSDQAEDTDATTATASGLGVPDAAQAAHEPQHVTPRPEPKPLSSNPKISMLSLRTRHCLMHAGIDTLEDLRDKESKDLLALPGFGAKALEDVDRFLSAQHLPPMSTAAAAESGSPSESEASRPDAQPFFFAPLESNPYFYMLSKRTYRLVSSAGISSIADLRRTDRTSLLALRGFGVTCLAEVDRFLEANGLPNTEFGSSVASIGQFDEKSFRFDALSERTRTLLRTIGISTVEDFRSRSIKEILEATRSEEGATDEIGLLGGLPTPRDDHEVLTLLFASKIARDALAHAASHTSTSILDTTIAVRVKVNEQIERGMLHPRAAMDWTVLQTLSRRFRPPADTLPDLLHKLKYSQEPKVFDAVSQLGTAIEITSLDDELDLLLERLDDRELEVLRQRFAVGKRRTLNEIGIQFGISRERVRQIEDQDTTLLRQAYYRDLPLLRTRTAMLLIRQNDIFAIDDMLATLHSRGLTASEQTVRAFLAVWRALDLSDSGVHESLVRWRAVDPEAYVFPEEILSVAKTGLHPRLQGFSKDVTRVARRISSRVGVVTPTRIREALDTENSPSEEDIVTILSRSGFEEVAPQYWVNTKEDSTKRGYSIPSHVVSKMLVVCGPLTLRELRRGLLRHQKRLGHSVPPIGVLGPMLAQQSIFRVGDDGICSLKTPHLHSANLGLAEEVWITTARTHGPIVRSSSIVRAFKEHNLQKITAYRLMMNSTLVEKVGDQLFCLPGTKITHADITAAREQAISGHPTPIPATSETIQTGATPPVVDSASLDHVSQEVLEPQTGEAIAGHLQYEARENRLSMAVPETTWQGDVNVLLSWGDQEFDLPSVYSPHEDTTTSNVAKLPINEPFWESDGLLVAGRSRRAARFPRPPLEHALVFRASDGKAVGRWRTGEEHYIILLTERMSEQHADEIFEEWRSLGQPDRWESFTALWVRTRDPLGKDSAKVRTVGSAAVLDTFSRATSALGLPDFDSLWRPRPRLVGGRSLGIYEGRERFANDHPPYLEVNGLWDSAIEVSLLRWVSGSAEFVKTADLVVAPPAEASSLVEVFSTDERAQKGRYRVEVGKQRVDFELTSPETLRTFRQPTVDLTLRKDDKILNRRDLTRHDLERSTLVGRAWPGARLDFTVSSSTWSHIFRVTADGEGCWSVPWRDLGVAGIPEGPLKLELSWRSLVGSELIIADEPFVAKDDVELSIRMGGSEEVLVLSGVVSRVGENRLARAVLLGAYPWAGEKWTRKLHLDERGAFETRFREVDREIRWLLILPEEEASHGDGRRPWLMQAQSEDAPLASYPLDKLRGERTLLWEELRNELGSTPLPPALERLILLSNLGETLERVAKDPASRSRWTPVEDPRALHRLLSLERFGLHMPVAVFSSAAHVIGTPPNETLPPLLTVRLGALTDSLNRGVGELPLECVTHEGNRRRVRASITLNESDGENNVELHAGELLYGCPRCGLILPPGEFSNHEPPGDGMPSCAATRRSMQLIGEGRVKPVTLVLLVNTEEVGSALMELVRRVVAGDEDEVPEHAAPWLDLLQEAYFEEGEDQQPESWLNALYSLHMRLRAVAERGGSEVGLANLGRSVRRYESGLDVLSRWLKGEVV